jgi:radical SAM superfamily enzyme YgiQ (UPF0313 family)
VKLEHLTLLRPNMGNYRCSDAMTPLSMAILAARTPRTVDITLFDDRVEPIPEDDQPDLVALTVETFTARRAYELADRYRSRDVPVVMGGYHPSFLPEEALRHADAIVVGDAEGSWERLLDDFEHGRMKRIYSGGNARPLNDVRLDRSIFRGKRYVPMELVQYARGCRFACDFCSIRAFYRESLRSRVPREVVDEIQAIDTGRLIFFVDDNLFDSRRNIEALLEAITPLRVRWCCQISIDAARDDRLLDKMAEAGCMLALIGFESLSEASLRQMGKPWNRVSGDYRAVVRKFQQRGMSVYGTFVFGYDADTVDSVRRNLDFALEANLEVANFNPLTPTPGSPLYDRLLHEGRLLSRQWWLDPCYRYGDPIFVPRLMTAEALAEECFNARRAFYSWRSIARRMMNVTRGLDWFRTGVIGMANVVSRREILRKQYRMLGA